MNKIEHPLILVCYMDIGVFEEPELLTEITNNFQENLKNKIPNSIAFFLPTKENERIECINPVITTNEQGEKINKLISDISKSFDIGHNLDEGYEGSAVRPFKNEGRYCVYMVECSDGTIYTGIAKDVNKRVLTHNSGKGAKYTKTRLPVSLKWFKTCENRSIASKEEYRIKKLTRKEKIKLIEDYGEE